MSTSRDHTPKGAGRDRKLESSLSNIKLFTSPKVSDDLIQCFTSFCDSFFEFLHLGFLFCAFASPKKKCVRVAKFCKDSFFLGAELYTVHGVEAAQDFLLCSHFPFISFSPARECIQRKRKKEKKKHCLTAPSFIADFCVRR